MSYYLKLCSNKRTWIDSQTVHQMRTQKIKKEFKFLAYRQTATTTVKTLTECALSYIQFSIDDFQLITTISLLIQLIQLHVAANYQSSSGYIPTYISTTPHNKLQQKHPS
jgi:hypothetical protein